jgi:hypothetical protein
MTISQTHNSDLWVALKGGSANFGLVTKFDMYAIPYPDATKPQIWGGNYIYDTSAGPAVIDAFVDFTNNIASDENSTSIIYWAYLPAYGGMILNAAVENTLAIADAPAFDGYKNVTGITADTTVVDDMAAITLALGSGQPAGLRYVDSIFLFFLFLSLLASPYFRFSSLFQLYFDTNDC